MCSISGSLRTLFISCVSHQWNTTLLTYRS